MLVSDDALHDDAAVQDSSCEISIKVAAIIYRRKSRQSSRMC